MAGPAQAALAEGLVSESSRGDRRWTFPNESSGSPLLWLILPQPFDFTADAFFRVRTE